MIKTLCATHIDPATIEPLVASRLIPLDKSEGAARPIGVGKVIQRIIGKCVMHLAKENVVKASSSLQLCGGQKAGSEAAILYLKQMTRTQYCSLMPQCTQQGNCIAQH